MTAVHCSPSLTLLPPPSEPARKLPSKSVHLLKLLSAFSNQSPVDFLARLLRDEARRVLRLPRLGDGDAT
ncbi:hypothetical protein FJ973_05840 [Mesorhizobium sp. B2-1-3]|uniref:hypothetical protein n=1 Tax=Mesorhizobium sp. B2-1-3 TaxID=2589972 RepID=UPI00112E787A|nr:hypothetical protein [Mesorhizobium sp. B2-1-3]TPN16211.1 hypothetical protein FJ973_05840 [Mesorhizobium sp. B2-1-3]